MLFEVAAAAFVIVICLWMQHLSTRVNRNEREMRKWRSEMNKLVEYMLTDRHQMNHDTDQSAPDRSRTH